MEKYHILVRNMFAEVHFKPIGTKWSINPHSSFFHSFRRKKRMKEGKKEINLIQELLIEVLRLQIFLD